MHVSNISVHIKEPQVAYINSVSHYKGTPPWHRCSFGTWNPILSLQVSGWVKRNKSAPQYCKLICRQLLVAGDFEFRMHEKWVALVMRKPKMNDDCWKHDTGEKNRYQHKRQGCSLYCFFFSSFFHSRLSLMKEAYGWLCECGEEWKHLFKSKTTFDLIPSSLLLTQPISSEPHQ